ncbi:LOW QUALITY PROTEIN: protein ACCUMULATION AND REPLICATION OF CHLOROPLASTS 3, chloroplastic-like [Phragmites australis]|uniref:LOW QUALITY PROTEIN: protein ACCUMULATION AND REPLICATION OF CHLOROPLASTS 3, chloroplastic-like n=1 Tax=Phragmites australis TaxID=29695 RepID=UPI002D7A1D38|nr:LOW QUALITY PROTEIN: protein ACCUMULATION AND REPLICATION OF CHLOROPLASTS 3, chloroplastic-like [Phragmites australis]
MFCSSNAGARAASEWQHARSGPTRGAERASWISGSETSDERKKTFLSSTDMICIYACIVEIRYGGGTYRGRCQGGVPEGKGRLISDGLMGAFNLYDGLWRYGKRSGLGTLFHSNGNVYHGTWRDDLIHGKVWYYFHSGDRWFANFWKGKANGEGRFYAKDGSIFFGHFQNGWRHGESLLADLHILLNKRGT